MHHQNIRLDLTNYEEPFMNATCHRVEARSTPFHLSQHAHSAARSSSARGTATASVHIIVCSADFVIVVKEGGGVG